MPEVTVHKDISNEISILEFIQSQSNITIFQTQYFLDLYNKTDGLEGIMFVCSEGNEILGVMLVQVQNYFGRLLKKLSNRSVIIGGPVMKAGYEKYGRMILEYYIRYMEKKVVYTQVRNIYNESNSSEHFSETNFKYIEHINYIIDLRAGEEELWKKLHSKRRNEVRKAVKEGVTFSEINYSDEMEAAYGILEKIYKKARLPLPNLRYFNDAYEIMSAKKVFRIFGSYYDKNLIGVMFTLCYNGTIYDWYAGSEPGMLAKCPNDLVTWEVFKWGLRNNYHTFDFGGAGNPNKEYGVRSFKKKFGGTEINTGRYELIHKPGVMAISRVGFKAWQSIKRLK
jgi:serine/alanine adding enzyme